MGISPADGIFSSEIRWASSVGVENVVGPHVTLFTQSNKAPVTM